MQPVPVDTNHIERLVIGEEAGSPVFLLKTFSFIGWRELKQPIATYLKAFSEFQQTRKSIEGGASLFETESYLALAEACVPIVRAGLTGWEHWVKAFERDDSGASDASLQTLNASTLVAIASAIYAHNSATVMGLGKLKSPSASGWGRSSETRTQPSLDAQDAGAPAAVSATTPEN
jgi:hypothetical protein